MSKQHVVVIDGLNFLFRATGWQHNGVQPGHSIVDSFLRCLRLTVETLEPTKLYFVLEGVPEARIAAHPSYKANRDIADDDPKRAEKLTADQVRFAEFSIAIELLRRFFPITIVRHPRYEADDTIRTIIEDAKSLITVVSSDSDFTQLLDTHPNVRVYNSIKKEYVLAPEYDYVLWKSLRGDSCDNIPGIPGIGDKRAAKLALDHDALRAFLEADPTRMERFTANYDLIQLKVIPMEECGEFEVCESTARWDELRAECVGLGLKRLTEDKAWSKFSGTFAALEVKAENCDG